MTMRFVLFCIFFVGCGVGRFTTNDEYVLIQNASILCTPETGGELWYGTVRGTATCLEALTSGEVASDSHVRSGSLFWNSSGDERTGTLGLLGDAGALTIDDPTWTFSTAGILTTLTFELTDSFFAYASPSTLFHDLGKTVLKIIDERQAAVTLPTGYREIPDRDTDTDGTHATSPVNKVIRTVSEWDTGKDRLACGMGFATIEARIANCYELHLNTSGLPSWADSNVVNAITWSGSENGFAGEGSWTLVTVYDPGQSNGDYCNTTDCREVWRDDRTGLLWSDVLGDLTEDKNQGRFNWCQASGNTQSPATSSVECGNAIAGSYNFNVISLCAESLGLLTPSGIHNDSSTTQNLASWDNLTTSILDSKGGMLTASATSDPKGSNPLVYWRLPTRNDFLQMDINGGRFVLPNVGIGSYPYYFWTATVVSTNRSRAWTNSHRHGLMYQNQSMTQEHYVRCVGRVP